MIGSRRRRAALRRPSADVTFLEDVAEPVVSGSGGLVASRAKGGQEKEQEHGGRCYDGTGREPASVRAGQSGGQQLAWLPMTPRQERNDQLKEHSVVRHGKLG